MAFYLNVVYLFIFSQRVAFDNISLKEKKLNVTYYWLYLVSAQVYTILVCSINLDSVYSIRTGTGRTYLMQTFHGNSKPLT